MPTNLPIERKRGDTRRHIFVVKDDKNIIVDVSGWSSFTLSVDPDIAPTTASNNVDNIVGAFVTDGTDGRISFSPTIGVGIGNYFYDAQATDANSEIITFAEGSYVITQDIDKT